MMRISIYVLSTALAALGLSATNAGAASVTVRTPNVQKVTVPTPPAKLNNNALAPQTPQNNFSINYGTMKMEYQNQTTGGGGSGKVHSRSWNR